MIAGIQIRELAVGPQQCGKTSLAVELAQGDVRNGLWHIAHDTGGDYVRAGFRYYEDVDEFWKVTAAARASKQPMCRGAAIGGAYAEPVIELAKEWVETARVPTVATGDEAILLAQTGATYLGKELAEVWARGHHIGIVRDEDGSPVRAVGLGLRINTQWPTQIPEVLYTLASHVHIFRVKDAHALHLEKVLNLEGQLLDEVRQLQPAVRGVRGGTYFTVAPGVGIVGKHDGESAHVSRGVQERGGGESEAQGPAPREGARGEGQAHHSAGADAVCREQPSEVNGGSRNPSPA